MPSQGETAPQGGSEHPSPPAGPSGAWIDAVGISHEFDSGDNLRVALTDVHLHVEPGEFVSIVGPSGCGKSTLLSIIAGYQQPTRGHAYINGEVITGPDADRGMVFQQHRLFPWMSVRANVEYGPRMAGVKKDERRAIGEEILELVGLLDVADRHTYELSGGMQQRAAIARALAIKPHVLLMDEPFSALDAFTRERLQDEVLAIWERTGVTVLFVTHSVDEAVYVGTRVVVMRAHPGRIIIDAPTPFAENRSIVGRRRRPEFSAMRDELTEALRTTAFEA